MKNQLFLFALVVLTITGCSDRITETVTYKINEPVFMSAETFRNSVKVIPEPRSLSAVGKMCFYNGYLYISEPDCGIHIIDNRNPSHPQNIGFINLMGNGDLAIRNGLLYADSYIDLVWFDITNPALPELKGRLDSIFPTALPPMQNAYGYDYSQTYSGKGIVVGWKLTERTENINHYTGGYYGGGVMYNGLLSTAASMGTSPTTSSAASAGPTNGINGSMSRFTIYNDKLYSVVNNSLNIFDLTGDVPAKVSADLYIGWNVETIFSYKTNLFFGTSTGLLIYSVADPLHPEYQSCIAHAYACDPVVVDNDLAYVTIHSGSTCDYSAKENSLIIIDVKNVKSPQQIVTYNLTNPKGLGIDGGMLFLCDDGLKIYQITTPQTLMGNQLAHYSGTDGYDVIPSGNTLMMIASDGLYQYDYSNMNKIHLISTIPIGK